MQGHVRGSKAEWPRGRRYIEREFGCGRVAGCVHEVPFPHSISFGSVMGTVWIGETFGQVLGSGAEV
jgi:hypothetical protein